MRKELITWCIGTNGTLLGAMVYIGFSNAQLGIAIMCFGVGITWGDMLSGVINK